MVFNGRRILIYGVQLRNVSNNGKPLPKIYMIDNGLIEWIRQNRNYMDSLTIKHKMGVLTVD